MVFRPCDSSVRSESLRCVELVERRRGSRFGSGPVGNQRVFLGELETVSYVPIHQAIYVRACSWRATSDCALRPAVFAQAADLVWSRDQHPSGLAWSRPCSLRLALGEPPWAGWLLRPVPRRTGTSQATRPPARQRRIRPPRALQLSGRQAS